MDQYNINLTTLVYPEGLQGFPTKNEMILVVTGILGDTGRSNI